MKRILYFLVAFPVAVCCGRTAGLPMPDAPDYSDPDMWYISDAGAGTDVFYILPTCVWDWSDSTGTGYHFADVYNTRHIAALLPSNELADEIFGEYANFYSPYYRQITLDSWVDDETVSGRFPYAMEDVKEAFRWYMDHWNGGRPFSIAGFSQGGKCVVELLKTLDKDEYSRLVAGYVIGYKVTEEDLGNSNIIPASGRYDTGVTVCYNSVEAPQCVSPGLSPSQICINPVSWTCSPEPAALGDSVTVSVDTVNKVLIVKGLDSGKYYHPSLGDLFMKGNYHLLELELYKDVLRENVRDRSEAFLRTAHAGSFRYFATSFHRLLQ